MKILFVDPDVNSNTSKKYPYYDGLFNGLKSIAKSHDFEIYHCKNLVTDFDLLQINNNIRFDYIVFGLGWFGSTGYFQKIKSSFSKVVVFLFKPQNDLDKKLNFCKINNVDLILTPVPCYGDFQKKSNIKCKLFPYGYSSELFKPRHNIEKKYDVGFSGALHQNKLYPDGSFPTQNLRNEIHNALLKIDNIDIFWKSSDNYNDARIHDHEEYAKTINSSKIWIATNASYGDVTPRYYEILGSGTLLFCEKIHKEYENILVDGRNCVSFNGDLSDFEKKLIYYLNNQEESNRIINNALTDFRSYTWENRAITFIDILKEI